MLGCTLQGYLMNDIDLQDWDYQIKGNFRKAIMRDFQNFHIFVEADLQSSLSRLMRQFIIKNENPLWRVYNQPYQRSKSKELGIYPDLLVTKRKDRRIALELKQSALRESRVPFKKVNEDIIKLGEIGDSLSIPTYLVYSCYLSQEEEETQLEQLESTAMGFRKPPEVVLINLRNLNDHGAWRNRMLEHLKQIQELYGGGII